MKPVVARSNSLLTLTPGDCEFSDDRRYRFMLRRVWHKGPRLINFLLLNPSTADEEKNDPTLERCERRARSMQFDGFIVTNLFAFRATLPSHMKATSDPVGDRNDHWISKAAGASQIVVCAWGGHGSHLNRSDHVRALLKAHRRKLHYLRMTSRNEPGHPLYLPYDLGLTPYQI